jgi:hypothetical protein
VGQVNAVIEMPPDQTEKTPAEPSAPQPPLVMPMVYRIGTNAVGGTSFTLYLQIDDASMVV